MILLAVPGFPGNQSSLNPVGPGASHIEFEFSLIFWITTAVYIIVLAVLVIGVIRRRHTLDTMPEPLATNEATEKRARIGVTAAAVVTVVLLFVMLIGSFETGRALGDMNQENAMPIEIYGHQWWWEVKYPNNDAYKTVETANEIHVPVGVPIRFRGTSRDVIHSFWAPNVSGKRDLMPGYNAEFVWQVDQPGRWRGQCAEYCGEQHAHMSFEIVAEPKDEFTQWLTNQAQSSVQPATPEANRGQQVFMTHACVLCHSIRGTSAGSRVGPDLTHLASRSTIAAGTLPNTAGNLGGWILNPQSIKPGCRMPPNQLSGTELQDLLAYLETLQ
ncbi:cytochrome c oxidase subunit II [Occallatibacter riparius]|uniref:cytochrome-c oxidase n=1 Tax=Occallatibacter riparius TaxID=1002689 RepID=A0A9J7BN34_9BACT|nr:cytochrome c oxidase subunit II [Occallatibacter riparius]UWZ84136.1 cytochrome c oxidase subunit II [Occallatibacter riparius]